MWEMKNFPTISPYDSKPVGFKCKNFLLFSPLHSLTLEMEVSIKRGHRTGAAWDLFAAFLCVLSLPLWLHVPLPLVQEESWPSLISPVSCAQINTRSVASRTVFTSSGFQVVFGKNLVFSWSRFFFRESCSGSCETWRLTGAPLQRCAVNTCCSASQFQKLKEVQSK